jgi:ESF2/ABP1 family protein
MDVDAIHDADEGAGPSDEGAAPGRAPKVIKPLTKKRLEKHLEAAEARGVLHFTRIPPYLKPNKLRDLLSGYGTEVLRIYLKQEGAQARAGRLRAGGNKKKNYTEGWVEFDDKRKAKRLANTLNNTPIGGGNRKFYAHDLWNVLYLHKFKWHDLTETIAYEARVKRDKMRAELAQAKKETSFYLQKVEQAKAIDAMEERKRKRSAKADEAADAAEPSKRARTAEDDAAALRQVRRSFKQRKVVQREADGASGASDALLGSLVKIRSQ